MLIPQNKATYFETAIYMQSQLLKDSDIQSMWHSLELRVPFLDIDLVNYLNNLHPSVKFNKEKTKQLLVDAFIDVLPKKIWNRPKQGFTLPFGNWFKEMKIFTNPTIVPAWANSYFLRGKLNFARLWAIFLIAPKESLSTINDLD
jgi:asparagine synthase (glutamine-hydrolysing)